MGRTLEHAEVAAAVAPMVKAFWNYPETVHLLSSAGARRRALPRYLRADADDAVRFDLLLGAEVDGVIRGAAAWIPPEAYPVSAGRQLRQALQLLPALPSSWRSLPEARRGQAANRLRHRDCPADHFYLPAIGGDPAAQSRGLGSSLVQPVLELADRRSAGCFLQTATIDNVSWYERFGFEIVDHYRPTSTWPPVWAMWRDPTTA